MPASKNRVPRCPEFNSTYNKGCRCGFCRRIVAAQNARYRYRKLQQERGELLPDELIPVDEVRALLIKTAKRGTVTDRDLERLTGIRSETFSVIRRSKTKRCRRDTAQAIFKALEYDDYVESRHPGSMVDSTWARQMTRSLTAQGFTRQHQAEIIQKNLGVNPGFIRTRSPMMRYENVQHIRWLVNAIGDRKGPSVQTIARMRTLGVFPTKHYDANGKLIRSSLSAEQRKSLEGV